VRTVAANGQPSGQRLGNVPRASADLPKTSTSQRGWRLSVCSVWESRASGLTAHEQEGRDERDRAV